MKSRHRLSPTRWALGTSALLLTLLLQACGGSGSASNAASGAQLANGVVTGFGSVFVDGVELEDAHATVVSENADGTLSNAALQMGQRIRVNHDGKGTASQVTVDAAVMGMVSAVVTATDVNNITYVTSFTVAGQKVSINTDATAGPLTVWAGGYDNVSTLATAGDLVEVHGSPVYDATTTSYKLLATRIQKMSAISNIKVNGKISNLNATAKTFSLNGLTVNYASATLRPTGASLADGVLVSVFGPTTALSGSTLTASNLKVNRFQDSTATVATTTQVGGQVSLYDSSAKTFEIQGIKVAMGTATLTPSTATVTNGAYVKVDGTVDSDGSITATRIQVREQSLSSDLAKVQLVGVISDFVDSTHFVVRGVPVDASSTSLDASCTGVTLANDVNVQVTATLQTGTPVVLASTLSCRSAATIVIRPIDGVVAAVNNTAKTFTLTLPNSTTTQTVQWVDSTTFVGLTSNTLNAATVRVEGYLNGTTLVARVISVSGGNGPGHMDDDAFRDPGHNGAANSAWNTYRNRRR